MVIPFSLEKILTMPRNPYNKNDQQKKTDLVLTRDKAPLTERELTILNIRKKKRDEININDISLQIEVKVSHNKTFRKDFTKHIKEYPHHEYLIQQLLKGAQLVLGGRLITYQSHQNQYLGIEEFIYFLNSNEPINSQVRCVADINVQVCKSFSSWLLRNYPGRTSNRKRYNCVRIAIIALQDKYSSELDIGTPFTWPVGPQNTEQITESYSVEIYNAIVDHCLEECDAIMNLMNSFHGIISHEEQIQERALLLENLMHDLVIDEQRLLAAGKLNPKHPKAFEWILRRRLDVIDFIKSEKITIEDFLYIYRSKAKELGAKGRPVRGHFVSRNGIVENNSRKKSTRMAVASVANNYPNWPLKMSLQEANHLFSFDWSQMHTTNGKKYKTFEGSLYQAITKISVNLQKEIGVEDSVFDRKKHTLETGQMAYFSYFFFTHTTIFPFILLIMINTGWNFEVVAALSDNLDDHIGRDLLDDDYVIIYSDKQRGKSVTPHRSNKKDRLGVYRVLRFVEARLQLFIDSPHYKKGSLWQAIVTKNLWNKHGSIITTVGHPDFANNSSAFLERHNINTNVNKKKQVIETRRMRTTYETKREAQGLSIDEISSAMNHKDIDTTAIHYGSDWGSTTLRHKQTRQIQNKLLDDFQNYKARLVPGTTLAKLRETISQTNDDKARHAAISKATTKLGSKDVEEVVHLLSPEGQTYIAACTDAKNPSWPGSNEFVSEGKLCRFFNRCPLCDKAIIFKEALPYIARRTKDLKKLRINMNPMDWSMNYGEELEAWDAILDNWNPPEEVIEAFSLSLSEVYTLPITLRGV